MPVARSPRTSTRLRRTTPRQGPRAPLHLVERMQAAVIGLVNAYIDRLMREIAPELRRRFGVHTDAEPFPIGHVGGQVALGEQFLKTTFHLVDRQAAQDLSRVIPVSTESVLPHSALLETKWIHNNTELIRLEARARAEVRGVIDGPLREGISVGDVRQKIEERLGVVRSRAEFIARDQTLKLYGQIQEARQTDAGIVEYTWSTSEDERVRDSHQALDGSTQRWDTPPVVDPRSGRTAHPGGDFQCRCAAIPILPDDAEASDNPPEPQDITPTPEEGGFGPDNAPGNDIELGPANETEPALPDIEVRSELSAPAPAELLPPEPLPSELLPPEPLPTEPLLPEPLPSEAGGEPPSSSPPGSGPPSSTPPSSTHPVKPGPSHGPLEELAAEKNFAVVKKGKVTADHEQAVATALERLRVGQGNTRPLPKVEVTSRIGRSETEGRVQLPRGTGGVYLDREWLTKEGRDPTPAMRVGVSEAHVGEFLLLGIKEGRDPWAFHPTVPQILPNGVDVGRFDVPENTQQLATTALEVIEWTTTHEYAHHLHLEATEPEVNRLIEAAFADRAKQPVSLYSTINAREFFAEAFTAYHHYPRQWLERNTPKTLRLVERVLELSGLK